MRSRQFLLITSGIMTTLSLLASEDTLPHRIGDAPMTRTDP